MATMSKPVKTLTVKVRMDPIEYRDLEWAAKKAGLPLSVWIRSLALQTARAQKGRAR